MKVSVIIPCLNEENYIATLLSDLAEQSYQNIEIIVVDGNSKDSTIEKIKKFPIHKLIQMSPQVASQRNIGAEVATGELLVFLDADTHISKQLIENIVLQFEKKSVAIAVPRYMPDSAKVSYKLFYLFFNAMFYLFQAVTPSGAGSAIFVKNNSFKKYGGFDSNLKYDDIELIRRIGRKEKFKIIPETVLVSVRRLDKYGLAYMIGLYLVLSILFCFNQFKLANKIKYEFGKF